MIDRPRIEPDYYAVLNVPTDATAAEIERAYRLLAGKRLNARWRPGQAARDLAVINAAYGILGYPERRADYDRRRAQPPELEPEEPANGQADWRLDAGRSGRGGPSLPRVQLGRATSGSPADAIIIVLVVAFALFVASVFASRSLVDLSFIQTFGEQNGLISRRRTPATPVPPPSPGPLLAPTVPSPAPSPATQPAGPVGALPTNVAAQRFGGSQVTLSSSEPARRTDLTVTLLLLREGQPVPNANVYLTAHYRTLDERQPPGASTVRTDNNGVASITFNVGDATAGHQVNVDVIALIDGQQVVFPASFTPR